MRVPTYEADQVQPARITNARLVPADNGGGVGGAIGAGLQQLGGEMARQAQAEGQIQEQKARIGSDALLLKLRSGLDELDGSYRSLNGQTALEARETTLKKVDSLLDDLSKAAPDARVRELFWHEAEAFRLVTKTSVEAWHRQQENVVVEQQEEAKLAHSFDQLVRNFDDPAAFQFHSATDADALKARARRLGWTDDVLEERRKVRYSDLLVARLNYLLANDEESKAVALYRSQSEHLIGAPAAEMTAVMQAPLKREQARLDVEDAIAGKPRKAAPVPAVTSAPPVTTSSTAATGAAATGPSSATAVQDPAGQPSSLVAAPAMSPSPAAAASSSTRKKMPARNVVISRILARAEQEKWPPERRDNAIAYVIAESQREATLEALRRSTHYEQALSHADRLGRRYTRPSQLGTRAQQVSPSQQRQLSALADDNQRDPRTSSTRVLNELRVLGAERPGRFAAIDLRTRRGQLTDPDYAQAIEMQRRVRAGKSVWDLNAPIVGAMKRLGPFLGIETDPSRWSAIGQDRYHWIYQNAESQLTRTTQGKRPPTRGEVEEALKLAAALEPAQDGWFARRGRMVHR